MCISLAWLSAHTVVGDHHRLASDCNFFTLIVNSLCDGQCPDYAMLSTFALVSFHRGWQSVTLSGWHAQLGNTATAGLPGCATAYTGKWMNSRGKLAINSWCLPSVSASEPSPCDTSLASCVGNKRLVLVLWPTAAATQTHAQTPALQDLPPGPRTKQQWTQ